MKNQRPYIGVTGVTTRAESENIRDLYRSACNDHLRKKKYWSNLMIGALVSSKTLRGETNRFPHRYPKIDDLSKTPVLSCSGNYRVLNIVHYSSDDRSKLHAELGVLDTYTHDKFDGSQFNMCWPDPEVLNVSNLGQDCNILQIGSRALESIHWDPNNLVNHVMNYLRPVNEVDLISYVLLDTSGGKGKPFDPDILLPYVTALAESDLDIGIGVAGGLSGETMDLVKPIIEVYPNICIDAEGRLRDEDDNLDFDKVRSYLNEAVKTLYSPN